MSDTPAWAVERAKDIVDRICSVYRTVGEAMYHEPRERMMADISAALTVPDGHVRLPSGEAAKTLGTPFVNASGDFLFPGANVWDIHGNALVVRTTHLNGITADHVGLMERTRGTWTGGASHLYSTRAAAESARAGGGA